MMKEIFKTDNSNNYLYAAKNNFFLYIPDLLVRLLDGEEGEPSLYYKRKKAFWNEKKIFDKETPLLDIYYDSAYIDLNMANLRQLLIEVTDECNLACKYCGYGELYGNYDIRKGKKQCFENVKLLIDHLIKLWHSDKNISFDNIVYIGFYGGEPLMNFPLIEQVVDYLEKTDIPGLTFEYNMTTNAVLLGKYMDFLSEKKFHLLLSLDGGREHNSYRVAKSGKESFDVVLSNIRKLKDNYPDYFDSHVNFNSVLHNRNSVSGSYTFIKHTFEKQTRLSELSYNGIRESKKEAFAAMFISKSESMKQSMNCQDVAEDWISIAPRTMSLSNFFEAYTGNTFSTMADLFYSKQHTTYLPTSTCPPFYKKIFLTVHGKIFPCEKIGQMFPLGYIEDGKINLDSEHIKEFYAKLYGQIIEQCKKCYLWKSCGNCIFLFDRKEQGKLMCNRFWGRKEVNNYNAEVFTYLEEQPEIYEDIIEKITVTI